MLLCLSHCHPATSRSCSAVGLPLKPLAYPQQPLQEQSWDGAGLAGCWAGPLLAPTLRPALPGLLLPLSSPRVGCPWCHGAVSHGVPLPQVNVDPEDLIPKLPKPRDLQPFPTTQALVNRSAAGEGSPGCPGGPSEVPCGCVGPSPPSCLPPQVYRGHTSLVRCLSISPSGQWLASGKDSLPGLGHPRHTRHQYPAPALELVPASPRHSAGLGARVGWGSRELPATGSQPTPLCWCWIGVGSLGTRPEHP